MRINFLRIIAAFIIIFINHTTLAALSCSITVTSNINYGTIITYDGLDETTTGNVRVICTVNGGTNSASYTLRFNNGQNMVSAPQRRARIGATSNYINHNIYNDGAYSVISGGPAISGTSQISMSYSLPVNSSRTDNFTIYGKIPNTPLAAVGTFTDSITVSLRY